MLRVVFFWGGAWLRAGEGIGWLAAGTMPNSLYRMPLVYLSLTCVFCYSCSFLFCRLCVCVFLCSHWSLVDVPLIFFCPADHVPDWQPRVLLGMVEARSVNVKKTTTTTTPTTHSKRGHGLARCFGHVYGPDSAAGKKGSIGHPLFLSDNLVGIPTSATIFILHPLLSTFSSTFVRNIKQQLQGSCARVRRIQNARRRNHLRMVRGGAQTHTRSAAAAARILRPGPQLSRPLSPKPGFGV